MSEEKKKKPSAGGDKKKPSAGGDKKKKRAAAAAKKKPAATGTKKKRAATSAGKKRAATKVPKLSVTVAIYEQAKSHHQRARDVVEALGYQVVQEQSRDEIVGRIEGERPLDVVIAAAPGGERLLEACRVRDRGRPVAIAALSGPVGTARERAEEVGADLFTLRPHSRESLSAALSAAGSLAAERNKVAVLEARESVLQERLQRYGEADAVTGFQHFDFFKQLLVMELKRAKRYGYSLAACLVALDPWSPDRPEPPEALVRKLRTRVATVVAACIRDIDLPVDYADDRFLAFLPYTDIDGALQVGQRIAKAVKSFGGLRDPDGQAFEMSVSVGIAALRPGKPISFARIMRDATAAVRASQLKGGGRVVVRK